MSESAFGRGDDEKTNDGWVPLGNIADPNNAHEAIRFGKEDGGEFGIYHIVPDPEAPDDYLVGVGAEYDPDGAVTSARFVRFRRGPITATKEFTADFAEHHPRFTRAAEVTAAVGGVALTVVLGRLWVKHRKK